MTRSSRNEVFDPPTQTDYNLAWTMVRVLDLDPEVDQNYVQALARVVYAAERARKLLSGIPTCAEKEQT